MASNRRIAFLSDSSEYGGHERVFLRLLNGVATADEVEAVYVVCFRGNQRFITELNALSLAKVHVIEAAFRKGRGEPYVAPLRLKFRSYLRGLIEEIKPDVVVLLQGRIECLCVPVLGLPSETRLVSYLPMAHTVRQMGLSGGWTQIPDFIRKFYYSRLDRFIVPSVAVANQLRDVGVTAQIDVVKNANSPQLVVEKLRAREELDLPADRNIALFMGRFDLHQKGLDILVDLIGADRSDWLFLIVGQGSGEQFIRDSLKQKIEQGACVLCSWLERPELALAAADVLLLPSRYEGVPLVMLEAMAIGLPIVASDIDVYREYLPSSNICKFSSSVEFDEALQSAIEPGARDAFVLHSSAVLAESDLESSRKAFKNAIFAAFPGQEQ